MNLANLLINSARLTGERPAVSLGKSVQLSYAQLVKRVAALADLLVTQHQLKKGDHVALIMKNCPEYIEILFGIWYAGLTAVPINAKLHSKEFAYILDHSQSKVCFCSPDLIETIAPLVSETENLEAVIMTGDQDYEHLVARETSFQPADLSPTDVAWLFYTSGTTGRPKGAMLTARNLEFMLISYLADIDNITDHDCIVHAAPLSHGSGMYILPHVARGANNVIPASGGFNTGETIELINHYNSCSFFFAPTMIHRFIGDPEIRKLKKENLKTIVYGGGPMYLRDLRQALDTIGPKFCQIYGQGEVPMTITGLTRAQHQQANTNNDIDRLISVGIARTGVAVKVFDENDQPLPPGEIGEIVCQGDIVMAGYWRNPEATAETVRNGWLHTGDMGTFDDSGFLTLKDRSKDMIISGGTNIYPREVEEVLLQQEKVAEASVVGRFHPDWGEEVVAFIVVNEGAVASRSELDDFCIDNIARFKRPREYRFVESLPKNNYGKILKTELRQNLELETNQGDKLTD